MGRHSFPGSDDESFDDAPESDDGGHDDGYDSGYDDGGRPGFDAGAGHRFDGGHRFDHGYGADFGADFGAGYGADLGSNLDAGLSDVRGPYTDDVDYGAGFDDTDGYRGGDYRDDYTDEDLADGGYDRDAGEDGEDFDYGDYADGEFIDPARYLRHYPDEADRDGDADLAAGGLPDEDTSTGRRAAVAWQGGHRSADGRRGVSVGVIAALVAVVLGVGAVIGWRFFGDSLSHRSGAAARHCVEGELAVPVVVDPALTDTVQAFAEKFNKTAKPVGDRCVSVQIATADSDAVVGGFIGDWPARLGQRPALWIPGSSVSVARLQAAAGSKTVSDSRSLVTSPVLLAVRPQLKSVLAKKGWADLPAMQTDPEALPQLRLLGWGPLRLALPVDGNSDAALLAGEAVAAAAAPKDGSAVDGISAVRRLAGGQPKLADASLATAMNALLGPESPAAAPVHAVATTEQQLVARGAGLSDPAGQLAGWLPAGPAAVADYPTVLLSGSWISQEQMEGASQFARFARQPDQLAELAKAGFRAEEQPHPASEVTDFPELGQTLSVGDDDVRATIATAFAGPAGRSAVTIMLDTSMAIDESGKSRLAHVVAALNHQLHALPGDAVVGLWTFDGVEGHSVISTGPLEDPVGGQARSAALTGELDGLGATPPGAVSFTTLRLVYNQALANYHDGQANSILVITTGPHTDRTLDGPGLRDFVRGATDAQRPVAVNVIDFGGDTDRPVWQDVAKLSGGSYQNLPGAGGPELASALATLLT